MERKTRSRHGAPVNHRLQTLMRVSDGLLLDFCQSACRQPPEYTVTSVSRCNSVALLPHQAAEGFFLYIGNQILVNGPFVQCAADGVASGSSGSLRAG